MDEKKLKYIGMGVGILGFVVSMLTNWVSDKQFDIKVENKVNEILDSRK